ncbi:lysine--tRNA ligase [Rossellomorea marisflavi]|uniref:lysine--tRNA ligase n=1 Tax=Rossellomorea marisflavi TaxID=189381 RepID=UPI00064F5BD5|nr:lysine--tRNA ligase [Rossellomorea marisflavi]KML06765.1 lysyl-tRNA synthetase [Rossellomorea marisflavi]
MHWAFEVAERIVLTDPDLETYTLASGISPSGTVHMGNFREVATTHFVAKALKNMGKNVRFIFSWDDYDRLRKIPSNIDAGFSEHIGKPYSEVPNPFGQGTWASHFEKEFETSLEMFNIHPEFIYQHKEYTSGRYLPSIELALKKRKEIYDILMEFKTNESSEDERDAFYPATVYCKVCRKDDVHIDSFSEEALTLTYHCRCGVNETERLDSVFLKLNWKVDWAMRWAVEGVKFEPGGRDHSSENGSYTVSKAIAARIFDYKAPLYTAYEFISQKGSHKKMSSSSGQVLKTEDLLDVYRPEVVLFLFARHRPESAFHIGLDDDVIKNHSEFERVLSAYQDGPLNDPVMEQVMDLIASDITSPKVSFNQIAGLLPLISFRTDLLGSILSDQGITVQSGELEEISARVKHWIQKWNPEKELKVNGSKQVDYFLSLPDDAKRQVQRFRASIAAGADPMNSVYEICRQEDKKKMKSEQKALFQSIYMLVLGKKSGPRLPLLLSAVGKDRFMALLAF